MCRVSPGCDQRSFAKTVYFGECPTYHVVANTVCQHHSPCIQLRVRRAVPGCTQGIPFDLTALLPHRYYLMKQSVRADPVIGANDTGRFDACDARSAYKYASRKQVTLWRLVGRRCYLLVPGLPQTTPMNVRDTHHHAVDRYHCFVFNVWSSDVGAPASCTDAVRSFVVRITPRGNQAKLVS